MNRFRVDEPFSSMYHREKSKHLIPRGLIRHRPQKSQNQMHVCHFHRNLCVCVFAMYCVDKKYAHDLHRSMYMCVFVGMSMLHVHMDSLQLQK